MMTNVTLHQGKYRIREQPGPYLKETTLGYGQVILMDATKSQSTTKMLT